LLDFKHGRPRIADDPPSGADKEVAGP